MKRLPTFLVLFLCAATSLSAQVVIPADRFPTALGDSFVSFTNHDAMTVSYDTSATFWDFSTGPKSDTSVTAIIPRSRTPDPDSFPLAQLYDRTFLLRDTTSVYLYGVKFADSLFGYGASYWDTTPPGQYRIFRFLPDMKMYPFPLQAGASWTSIDSIPVGTYMGFRVVLFDTSYGRVLKEGTVTVPYGGPSPCLMMRSSRRGLIKLRPINLIVDTVYQETAEWLVPDWGAAVTISSAGKDSSWPITSAAAGGFTRLWQLLHVGVEENASHLTPHAALALGPAFPNPMRDHTVIPFSYPLSRTPSPSALSIYDPVGRLVCVLTPHASRFTPQGFVWDGLDEGGKPVGSGVYFYRLEAGSFVATRKLVVVR